MINVVGVRFRHTGRVYYFNPGVVPVKKNDYVIVETAGGLEYGMAATDIRLAADDDVVAPVRPVIRIATEEDAAVYAKNLEEEKKALVICAEKCKARELEMNLIGAEMSFDGSKLLFFFTAEGRVDFRDLVKDLASAFHTRIELRQIGVRDEAKMGGGIGICGRPFCCSTFLSDFAPVSIKMAKDQNLSLNPTKISGTCGRLMCCLKYEQATYEELNSKLPNEGDTVSTVDGTGEVLHVNVLRQLIKVGIKNEKDDVVINEYKLEDIKILEHKRRRQQQEAAEDEKQLKDLEKN